MKLDELAKEADRRLKDREFQNTYGVTRNYQKFFEGYEKKTVVLPGGKTAEKMVYTGTLYERACTDLQNVLIKCAYVLFSLIGTGAFIAGDLYSERWQNAWYVVVFKLAAILGFLWIVTAAVFVATRRRKLTVYDYSAGAAMIKRSALFTTLALVGLITVISVMHFAGRTGTPEMFQMQIIWNVAAVVAVRMIAFTENRSGYRVVQNS